MKPIVFGMDKIAHLTVSALAVIGAFLLARHIGFGDFSVILAVFFAFALGYGKEAWDAQRAKDRGDPNWQQSFSKEDLTADAIGAALAALMILLGGIA